MTHAGDRIESDHPNVGHVIIPEQRDTCGWFANHVAWTNSYNMGSYTAYCYYCVGRDEVIEGDFIYDGKLRSEKGKTALDIVIQRYACCDRV